MTELNIIDSGRLLSWNVGYRKTTTGIVLHHAEAVGCTVYDVNNWHKGRGWAGIGYHFYVRRDGSVYTGREIGRIGAHAGANPSKPAYKYDNWANLETIGICAEGRYDSDTMPEVQKQAIVSLCRYCIEKYPAIDRIYRHSEISATDCPGKNFPFEEIVGAVFGEEPRQLYRVRRAWDDAASQTGAFASLENAIKACPRGYAVFDADGNEAYRSPFTAEDARLALRIAAGLEKFDAAYDLDSDGAVSAEDARKILRDAAKLD